MRQKRCGYKWQLSHNNFKDSKSNNFNIFYVYSLGLIKKEGIYCPQMDYTSLNHFSNDNINNKVEIVKKRIKGV